MVGSDACPLPLPPPGIEVSFRSGTVESRMRQLVMKLELVDSLRLAHPFIKGFDRVSNCLSDDEFRAVAQGEISDAVGKRTKEETEGQPGARTVYTTTFFIGLQIEPKLRQFLTHLHPTNA